MAVCLPRTSCSLLRDEFRTLTHRLARAPYVVTGTFAHLESSETTLNGRNLCFFEVLRQAQ
eukprot:3928961-Pleurochrysis_carterae.AAC.1